MMTADRGTDTDHKFWPWDIELDYWPHMRASGLQLARTCPGSMFLAQAEAMRGNEHESPYAAVGTAGHAWLQMRIELGEKAANAYLAGLPPSGLLADEDARREFLDDLHLLWDWTQETGLWIDGAEALTEEEVEVSTNPPIVGHADLIQVHQGLVSVTDWKFYRQLSMLPDIVDDMQMYAYAIGASDAVGGIDRAQVHRVLCYHQREDVLDLDREGIELARRALAELARDVWERRRSFCPGAQCGYCFYRSACPAYRSYEGGIDASEIVPYQAGKIATAEDVLAFLLAAQQVEARIAEGREAAKAWVAERGPVVDPATGKQWKGWPTARDAITDPAAAIGRLGQEIGDVNEALKACSTTKTALERALKAQKRKPKERSEFLSSLRDAGIIEKREGSPRWEWRKPAGVEDS